VEVKEAILVPMVAEAKETEMLESLAAEAEARSWVLEE